MSACRECVHRWGGWCQAVDNDEWDPISGQYGMKSCAEVNTGPRDCIKFEQTPVPVPPKLPPQEVSKLAMGKRLRAWWLG